MSSVVKQKAEGALYPNEVTVAVRAFEAAIAVLQSSSSANAPATRLCLAEYISAHALFGELDVETLRDGALRYLRQMHPSVVPSEPPAASGARSWRISLPSAP